MRKVYTCVFVFITCAISLTAFAQHVSTTPNILNLELQKIATPDSKPSFINFRDDVKVNPSTLFTEFKNAFGLNEDDQMVPLKAEKDELGFTHHTFQQFYKNIRVDMGVYKVHTNNEGFTYAANGKVLTNITLNTTPSITSEQVIDNALKYVNAKAYKWQSDYWQNELKSRTGRTDSSYYPVPELVIREIKNHETGTKNNYLVYRLDIYAASPDFAQRLFIDAHNGKVTEVLPLQSN